MKVSNTPIDHDAQTTAYVGPEELGAIALKVICKPIDILYKICYHVYKSEHGTPRMQDSSQSSDSKTTLVESVSRSLRQAIVSGIYQCGERLDQDLIARSLGVSRTPLREAIHRLEGEGLLEVRPHFGAYAMLTSPHDIRDVYDVRCLLEPEVVRRATPSIPDSTLDELERLHDPVDREFEPGALKGYPDRDTCFHQTIISQVDNSLLKDILTREVINSLSNRMRAVHRFGALQARSHMWESCQEHLAILQAMRERAADRAASLMKAHLEASSDRLQVLAAQYFDRVRSLCDAGESVALSAIFVA